MYRSTEHKQEMMGGKRDKDYFFSHPHPITPPSPPHTHPTPHCSNIPQKSDQEQLGTRQLNKWVLIINCYFLLLLQFWIIIALHSTSFSSVAELSLKIEAVKKHNNTGRNSKKVNLYRTLLEVSVKLNMTGVGLIPTTLWRLVLFLQRRELFRGEVWAHFPSSSW